MNHRTYDAQRYSPLDEINKTNIRSLSLPTRSRSAALQRTRSASTPLAEDGYLYVVDQWGVVYKIDGRSGDVGRIVWRMDPGGEVPLANRGVALWGDFVIPSPITRRASSPPTRKPERSYGRPTSPMVRTVCSSRRRRSPSRTRSCSALPVATTACAPSSWRSMPPPANCCGRNSSFRRRASWQRDLEGQEQDAWQTGGGAMWVTGSYDPGTNQVPWGTGNRWPLPSILLPPRR